MGWFTHRVCPWGIVIESILGIEEPKKYGVLNWAQAIQRRLSVSVCATGCFQGILEAGRESCCSIWLGADGNGPEISKRTWSSPCVSCNTSRQATNLAEKDPPENRAATQSASLVSSAAGGLAVSTSGFIRIRKGPSNKEMGMERL